MSIQQLSEQEQLRREKLAELIIMGIEPYPAPLYPVNNNSAYIKQNYSEERKAEFADVCLAGRLMSVRDMGKANFAVIQDGHGKIQLYIRRDDICPSEDKSLYDIVWKKLIDLSDIIGVRGYAFVTKTGETSVHVKELTILSKSLKPLPVVREADGEVFDAVTDPEFRYRQRYVDLIINPSVKETFIKKNKAYQFYTGIFKCTGCAGSRYTRFTKHTWRSRRQGLLLHIIMHWMCRFTCGWRMNST
jgi:lysyl-tRNA synthetase class 2